MELHAWTCQQRVVNSHHDDFTNGSDLVLMLEEAPEFETLNAVTMSPENLHLRLLNNLHLNKFRRLKARIQKLQATIQDLESEKATLIDERIRTTVIKQQLINEYVQEELQEQRDYYKNQKEAQRRLNTSHARMAEKLKAAEAELLRFKTQIEGDLLSPNITLDRCKTALEEPQKDDAELLWVCKATHNDLEARYWRVVKSLCDLDRGKSNL